MNDFNLITVEAWSQVGFGLITNLPLSASPRLRVIP